MKNVLAALALMNATVTDAQLLTILNESLSGQKEHTLSRGAQDCVAADERAPKVKIEFHEPGHDLTSVTGTDGRRIFPIFRDEPRDVRDLRPEVAIAARINEQSCETLYYTAVTRRTLRIYLDDQLKTLEGNFLCTETGAFRKGIENPDGTCLLLDDRNGAGK